MRFFSVCLLITTKQTIHMHSFYKITCNDSENFNTGLAGQDLYAWIKEDTGDIKNINPTFSLATHIQNMQHRSTNINNNLQVLYTS